MSFLSGGGASRVSQRRLDVWKRQVGISAYVGYNGDGGGQCLTCDEDGPWTN